MNSAEVQLGPNRPVFLLRFDSIEGLQQKQKAARFTGKLVSHFCQTPLPYPTYTPTTNTQARVSEGWKKRNVALG